MSNEEMEKHLDYLDGVLLAHSLVVMALVKHQPTAIVALKHNLEQTISRLEHIPMAAEKRRALSNTLDKLLGTQSKISDLIDAK